MKSAHTSSRCILVLSVHSSHLAREGGFVRRLFLVINKYMGISKAYGRAIGTNFGFPGIAQSPPPEPELPLSERRRGARAREGGQEGKAWEAYSSYLWLVHADKIH